MGGRVDVLVCILILVFTYLVGYILIHLCMFILFTLVFIVYVCMVSILSITESKFSWCIQPRLNIGDQAIFSCDLNQPR